MKDIPLSYRIIARLMRAFFYLLYHPLAWTYDWVAAIVSLGMWKDWVMSVEPELTGPRILEIGHGPGHLQTRLAQKGLLVFGLDASPQMGKLAFHRLTKNNQVSRIVRGYAQLIPSHNGSFNQIISTFPSEYILDPQTITEAHRVLKPGGQLVILPVVWITGSHWTHKAAAWLFRVTGQTHAWDPRWLAPFQKAGFQTRVKRITRKSWSAILIICRK